MKVKIFRSNFIGFGMSWRDYKDSKFLASWFHIEFPFFTIQFMKEVKR